MVSGKKPARIKRFRRSGPGFGAAPERDTFAPIPEIRVAPAPAHEALLKWQF
jgi:hypothetical protein